MSYPKPLSQKTLDKMYKESNLSEEKIVFLRKLFDSASALYESSLFVISGRCIKSIRRKQKQ